MSAEASPFGEPIAPSAPLPGLGRPIRGPRALNDNWRRFWHLTYNMARNEFKLKFFGSALGYLWQVMKPLLLFGVTYVFFVLVVKVGGGHKPSEAFYGVQLLGSIVLFTFFQEATGGCVRCVVDRENLVRKIQFPRLAIPLSLVLLSFFNLMMNLVVVLIFALISGVQPMLSWLVLPLILVMLVLFSTGLSMLLSALFVRARDIQPIWEVLLQVIFYGSPVIIPLQTVQEKLAHGKGHIIHRDGVVYIKYTDVTLYHILYHIYLLNPLVTILQQFRHSMVTHATPSAGEALGSWAALLGPLAVVAAIFALGFWVFNRSAPYVAENL